jgi:cytochrome c-type biogenesis protein
VDISLTGVLRGNPALALPVLFFGGVLTSFTPCIYPMIPITAAIVGGSQAGTTAAAGRFRPLTLSLVYALGLSLVYASLGLFAGLSGTLFGTISSNPWMYFAMANVLVFAALAMLDVIPIHMPAAAVLTWVSTTKSAALGFLYLFAFSLGMCTLLVAVGTSSGFLARLPRAGLWMVWIKRIFAFVMIGVAEYYLIKMGQLIL